MKNLFIIIALVFTTSTVSIFAVGGAIEFTCVGDTGICFTYVDDNGNLITVPGECMNIGTPEPSQLICGPTDVTIDNIFVHNGATSGTGTGYDDGHGCVAQDGSEAVFEPATGVSVETDYTTWENSVTN